eukprot:gene13893-566_t
MDGSQTDFDKLHRSETESFGFESALRERFKQVERVSMRDSGASHHRKQARKDLWGSAAHIASRHKAISTFQGCSPMSARIDLSQPRYDQDTYMGRFRHFVDVTDPMTLLTTLKQVEEAQILLDQYEKSDGLSHDHESLWSAKKKINAVKHPDDNTTINPLFRFSCFVPMNICILLGMLRATSTPAIMFFQAFNQSYNVAVNYANRNKTTPTKMEEIAAAYFAAVGVSCGTAYTLGRFAKNATRFSPGVRSTIQMFVPYIAVASA